MPRTVGDTQRVARAQHASLLFVELASVRCVWARADVAFCIVAALTRSSCFDGDGCLKACEPGAAMRIESCQLAGKLGFPAIVARPRTRPVGSRVAAGDERSELALDAAGRARNC